MSAGQGNALELTVRLGCPVRCGFCPQDLLIRNSRGDSRRVLGADDLAAIISNATRRQSLRIIFAGFAEPFSVDHVRQLFEVCERHDRVHRVTVYTTGEGLTTEDLFFLKKLRKLYPDREPPGNRYLNFHVRPRHDYSLMRGARGGIWELLPEIAGLFPHCRFVVVSEPIVLEHLEQMQRELARHHLLLSTRALESRAGNIAHVNGRPLPVVRVDHPVTCAKVREATRMPVVLPDGSVYACCNDYGRELPIGNLLSDTWEDLDFSRVRATQSDPTANAPCFRGCHFAEASGRPRTNRWPMISSSGE